ncbi:MAG: SurA N-terminal domain-containing protein, partial [Devosia sp.]
MLDALRRLGRTWIGKIVGVFLIIGLAGFGISNVIFDFGSNVVARVGSEDITTQEFSRAYQQQINSVANQLGYTPTAEQALQMGIPSTVISGLATEAAIGQTTNKLGLGVSDAKLRDIIQSNSNFFSMLGRFDRDIFNQVLQSSGYTEAEYVELERRQARRDQFETGLLGGSYTSQTARDLVNHYANDKRIIEYFTLDAASIDPVAVPTEDELAAYLKEHQTEFRTLEARTADVLVFTPDILAAQRVPTDEQVKAEYDRTKDQLVKIEKRHIQQVSMPTEGTARWFEIKRDAGTSFEDALKESGLTATDLGTLSKAEVTDPALGDAAFGLARAGDFTVIAGIGSRRLVAVTDIQPGGPVTFDEAKADIATRLALEAAKAEYTDVQDQIEELRAAFRPIKEIADRFKLPLANVTLNSDGAALSAVNGIAAENRARVAAAIFGAQEGKLSAAVTFGATNNVYFDLG